MHSICILKSAANLLVRHMVAAKPILKAMLGKMRVSSRENLSSRFATRVDSNRPAQPQKLDRGLKLRI